MTLKKTLAVGMSAALAVSLAACSSDSSGSKSGKNYVLANGSEPQNPLIPANTNETGGGRIVDVIYSGLVRYDSDGKAHNEQAESITLEGDRTYKVTLKDGLKFSDGTPIKAENYVKTWNYAVANDQRNASFFELVKGFDTGVKELEGLKVIDDKTFSIELSQPVSDFPARLGYSAYFALPDVAFDDIAAFGEKPISSGPYKVAEWNHNESITPCTQ